tara:strand:- start:256 stop:522 length:267 start_codon:yes stop_codon:yes gene_type:complete
VVKEVETMKHLILTLSLILGIATSANAQPAEGKILQRGKIIYINEIKSFGKVEDLNYHVMYKDRYYLCKFADEAKDYFCNEIAVITEQ